MISIVFKYKTKYLLNKLMEIESGYIYCISNLDIMPGIYKVGVTMRSPLDRLKEANSSDTWKIPSYKIEFAKKVTNPKEKEKTLHRLMEKFMKRVHPRREFFRGEIDDIKEAFKLMDGDLWNETPVEPVVRDEPIHFENRLSEDPDIRIQQIMELIQQVFKNHTVQFKENGKLSGHNHYPVMVDEIPIFIIENHDNGRRNVAMISTFPRNKVPDFINDYYRSLTWDLFGGSPIAIRKQYDTEGKTKEDIINVLKGFKTALSQKGGEIKKVDELEKVKSRVDKVKLKEDLKKKETEQNSYSMNYWYDNMKNWMGGNSENNNSPSIDSDDSNSQISENSGEENNGMKELEICKSSEHKRKGINFWVLYNKRNHRCNNRKATYNELKYALDNWNTTEMIKPECKIIIYPPEDYKSLLEKCLLFTESKEDKEVICALGQDWGNEYLITGECSWNKIIVYDSREKQYYLRSFTKMWKRGDGKELIKSRINGWYVDLSTMGAPREFWDYLKNKLSDPSQPLSHKVKRILWSDEEGEITDKFNNTYSFGDYWKPDNNYIKKIHKNGRLFKCEGGVHRGYSIWLDNEDIVHISHGHKNKDIISHCIFNDNSLTSGWMCNWGDHLNCKLTKEEIQTIHNHFGI